MTTMLTAMLIKVITIHTSGTTMTTTTTIMATITPTTMAMATIITLTATAILTQKTQTTSLNTYGTLVLQHLDLTWRAHLHYEVYIRTVNRPRECCSCAHSTPRHSSRSSLPDRGRRSTLTLRRGLVPPGQLGQRR